ncbi:MAG: hypothetical protein IT514_15795 [Burkholderiales bacterium]|nr:hypothetical protein [Burkholderiales bacterium]
MVERLLLVVLGLIALAVGWLLMRRSKIRLSELVCCYLVYGLLLGLFNAYVVPAEPVNPYDDTIESKLNLRTFNLAFLLLMGVGLIVGAANARGLESSAALKRWTAYLCGILAPLTTLPGLFMAYAVAAGGRVAAFEGIQWQGPLAALLLLPAAVTLVVLIRARKPKPA